MNNFKIQENLSATVSMRISFLDSLRGFAIIMVVGVDCAPILGTFL
jgi:uncharacterized membrane protein